MRNSIFLFVLLICSVCRAEWFDNDTRYRLEVVPEKPGEVFFTDLENKIFPADFKKGVSVFNDKGKPVPFFFSKDSKRLFIASGPEDALIHVYFGFDKQHPLKKWDNNLKSIDQEKRLEMKLLKLRIISREQSYLNTDAGLLDLINNTFQVSQPILEMQQKMQEQSDLRSQKRKLDRERAQANDQKQKDDLKKQQDELDKTIENLRQEFIEAEKKLAKNDLEAKHYKQLWTSQVSRKEVPEIQLEEQTFGDNIKKHDYAAAEFKGKLYIKESGDYAFAIDSKDGSMLMIDGKPVLAWPGYHNPGRNWDKNISINLQPGLHDLGFYYFKRGANEAFAEVSWKKPGDKDFKVLQEADFSPAFPAKIVSCEDKEKHSYPIVNYEWNGFFLLEDGFKADWINCQVESESNGLLWMSDKTVVSKANSSSFLLMRNQEGNLVLNSKNGKFPDIPLKIPPPKKDTSRFDPEIELKIWTPSFVYDEEVLDMDIEMVSGLPRASDVLLKTEVSRPNGFLKDETRFINLKGREQFHDARFSPPSRLKENIEIVGSELQNGLDVNFYLMIPPVVFSQHSVRFIPIGQCTDVNETVDGLMDAKGRRVIPILHRPDLAEKRVWSLSKTIVNELSSPKKLLLIADDFGVEEDSLSNCLKKKLAAKKIELEFLPWQKTEIGSSLRGSLGGLIPAIQKSTADRILIIPPIQDINTGIPVRTQTRALAAMMQVAQSNKNIRIIYAASPFPSLRRTQLDNELTKSIEDMSEEYNIEFFDMNSFIRNKPNWRNTYRFDESNDGLYEPYPVHLVEEVSQRIFDSL